MSESHLPYVMMLAASFVSRNRHRQRGDLPWYGSDPRSSHCDFSDGDSRSKRAKESLTVEDEKSAGVRMLMRGDGGSMKSRHHFPDRRSPSWTSAEVGLDEIV